MNVPYVPVQKMRQYALEALGLYQQKRGKEDVFPLDAVDLFDRLFGLPTIYDEDGIINDLQGEGVVGCLFPDGQPSPWRKDKVIVVNLTRTLTFDPTKRNETFTVCHEGMGHYVLHFLKGIAPEVMQRAIFCRDVGEDKPRKPRLEFQADMVAGELMMPYPKVTWLLDGKQPPEMLNLELYAERMMEYFGANRSCVEMRLKSLGYKLMSARYEWADWRHRPQPSGAGGAQA